MRAKRVKSGNVCDMGGFSPIDIPNRSGIKGGKINTVRRETAASLLYCGHKCDPLFCDVWHSHQVSGWCSWGESSISLTSMGLSGGGCPFMLLPLESHCVPLPQGLHVPRWFVFPPKQMLPVGRNMSFVLYAGDDITSRGLDCILANGYIAAECCVHTFFTSVC